MSLNREPHWDRRELLRRTAPFAAIILLAFATLPLTEPSEPGALVAAVVIMAALTAAVVVLPWNRLPRPLLLLPPLLALVIVALLRHGEGGAVSGFGVLVLVPVVWLALYGTRRELILLVVAIAAVFVAPILLFGDPDYPDTEWRRAILVTALSAFVGLTTQSLVRQVRLRAGEAERRAQAEAKAEAYLRAVMDSTAEGVVALDTEGKGTFANQAAAEMLGYKVAELHGVRMHDLIHHTKSDGSPYPIDECPIFGALRNGRQVLVSDEVFWRKDGSSFPVEYRAMPMVIDGATIGVVNTFFDISERLAIERMKSEFVSVVSHELRTPLTSIRGSLGLLEGGVLGELSEEAQRMLGIAISNADRLVRLINDILDAERIDSGNAPMQMRRCDLAELMTQTHDLLATSADEARVTLDVRPLNVELIADPDRIIQTLVNLIGNAIKFSPTGTAVRVDAEATDERVRVLVRDQGPGIPAEQREAIFDRFSQVESPDTRVKGGSGLGLAIARGIIDQHGGRIWIESSGAQGSTFAFELPLARTRTADREIDRGGKRLGVLVVEDDTDLADVLLARFERQGVSGRRAATVAEAERVLAAERPELIVLDLELPGPDGDVLVDWLRGQRRLEESAVLIYTARDLAPDELRDLHLRAADVVTKSRVTSEEFERRAMETLERVRARGEHRSGS